MRKFLITAHGKLASGIKSSLDIIIGETKNLFIIDAYTDENKSIEEDLQKILRDLKSDDELVVFTDLMGGSITNQVLRVARLDNVHVISGINLPLLIDILLADIDTPIADIIENSLTAAREQLAYVNKLITKDNAHD